MISQLPKRYPILSILIFLSMGFTISCSEMTRSNPEEDPELISTQISIRMVTGDLNQEKASRIDAIDMLIFIRDPEGKLTYSFTSITNITVGPDGKLEPITHPMKMKSGSTIDIHLFANVHQELVDKGLLSESLPVDQVKNMFETLLHSDLNELNSSDSSLPMYGKHEGALINSSTIPIPIKVTRCVAKVGVQLAGTTNFKLRALYLFYAATGGRIVPDESAMELIAPGQYKITKPSFPQDFSGGTADDFVAIIHDKDVSLIEDLYIYENKIWTAPGVDRASTRIVVGGLVNNSPELTYFLIKSATNSFSTFIRNHQYIVNIGTIATSGFTTPLQAANSELNTLTIDAISTPDWGEGVMDNGDVGIN